MYVRESGMHSLTKAACLLACAVSACAASAPARYAVLAEDAGAWPQILESIGFQSAAPGHGDVKHHDIPRLLPDEFERLLRVAGLAEHGFFEFIGENLLQAMSHYSVIVCYQYFHCAVSWIGWER